MPALIPDGLWTVIQWNVLSLFVAALFGARIGWAPFRLRQVAGATLGLLVGIISILPVMLGSFWLLRFFYSTFNFSSVEKYGGVVWVILFYLITFSVSYLASLIGRPPSKSSVMNADPVMMMETLDRNADEMKQIVQEMLHVCGFEVGGTFDVSLARHSHLLSDTQASRLADILRMRTRLEQSRSVLHSDLQLWAERSGKLLDELTKQLAKIREPLTTRFDRQFPSLHDGNPYAPPYSDPLSR